MPTDIQDGGLLAQAAALAGATVTIVKHSGRSGTHQEFAALVKGLEDATAEYPNNGYVQQICVFTVRQGSCHLVQGAGFSKEPCPLNYLESALSSILPAI